jgi:hypothetical protein
MARTAVGRCRPGRCRSSIAAASRSPRGGGRVRASVGRAFFEDETASALKRRPGENAGKRPKRHGGECAKCLGCGKRDTIICVIWREKYRFGEERCEMNATARGTRDTTKTRQTAKPARRGLRAAGADPGGGGAVFPLTQLWGGRRLGFAVAAVRPAGSSLGAYRVSRVDLCWFQRGGRSCAASQCTA